MSLVIEAAGKSDVEAVLGLYGETIRWLAERGFNQWQGMVGVKERIKADIARGDVWIVRSVSWRDRSIAASIKLDSRADPEFWQPDDDPKNALYAHRMMVNRSAAGKQLGSAMLDWASRRAASTNKRWLRLDAWSSNDQLHRYYLREGFAMVRLLRFSHRGSGALFQRPAGVVLGRGPQLVTKVLDSQRTAPTVEDPAPCRGASQRHGFPQTERRAHRIQSQVPDR